jgi:hypothetical protein
MGVICANPIVTRGSWACIFPICFVKGGENSGGEVLPDAVGADGYGRDAGLCVCEPAGDLSGGCYSF